MGSAINLDEIKRFEVTEVYSHPDAKVDIVFVHGLNGDPRTTWTAKGNGTFWPTQLLPVSLKSAQARILVYGYNADVYTFGSSKSASTDMIHQHAQTFVSNLALERKSEEVSDHPIIFVAHSLGGILVKRALQLSNDLTSKNADDNRSIFVSTYGILFLGTPHTGADPAKWGLILQGMVSALVPKKMMDTESHLVKTLMTNNETLQNINLGFLNIYQKFKICMVHESVKTDLKGSKSYIVDQISASPMLPDVEYFGIEASHSGMCKFESKNSPGYLAVSQTIKDWVQEAPRVIQARRDMEIRQRRQALEAQAAELLHFYPQTPQGSTSAVNTPDPSNSMNNSTIMVRSTASIEPDESQSQDVPAPYFIKPSGFRPNSLFVGREAELTELHKMIFDKKRRAEGTSAVLIQSMPGGGKSHLARQYVYQHKDDFPGGIFWLRAKSAAELASGFWDIARKAALKHLVGTEEAGSLDDPQQFIKMVKKWLNHRNDWLMVLDGIHFDDTEELSRFIPDSTNTGLIYTSTEKSVSGSHYFMNPQVIKLPLLSAVEAQRLLLLELDRKEPFSKDDLKHSMELVQAMGFLPVVIHSVAQRLKTTDEPLSKFARHYANEPRLRGLGTYMAVVEQLKILGAYEALNLVYILCFFSQHIPVEMIALGIKALEYQYHIPVKASEPITGRSLNNTFKMLNTFALIDRNEHEVSMHSSQSSKSSRDMLADNVDVIRLHSVVQGFFVDTLLAEGTLSMWLDLAVRVFCCSYDLASERILRKTNAGLVEDYRLYEIHGIKIGEHLTRHLSRHLKPDERIVLEAAQKTLSKRCEAIKSEIERRTPEFSQVIAGRKSEQFQTSIFDRTSSSSDTGPETPGIYGYPSRVSTWGLEPEIGQIESPSSITHDAKYYRRLEAMHSKNFPMPMPEDDGYDSDRESSVAMTLQPSQQTVQQDPHSPTSPGKDWKLVERKQKGRTAQPELGLLHRTIRNMEKQRYSDSAGAYRAVSAPDPRVSHEAATGFLQRNSGRAQSRGRLSGQSSAEVALADISKNSPPPTRGGGVIRPTSQRGSERGRVMTGMSSYAAAVAEATRDTVSSVKELVRPPTEASQSSPESTSTLELPQSSAVESLQKFPIEVTRQPPSPILSTFTPMPIPPYPQTPHGELPDGQTAFPFDSNYNQENTSLGLDPYPSNIYPRKTGPIPFETRQPAVASSSTSPPRNLQQGYPTWQSQTFSGSLPSAPMHMPSDVETPPFLSLSTPDITRQQANNAPYYPGRPELSNQQGGYTSQPMSRDPSGQSKNNSPPSNHSAHSAGHTEGRRRPSLAETEPLPQLPIFSPRIPPTSYQVYERMKQLEREGELRKGRELERGATNKIPRLEYARAALIERLDEWNSPAHSPMVRDESISPLPTTRRQFNPTAPSFSPSPSSFTRSPNLPTVPPNSTFSNPSTNPSAGTSAYATAYPSPLPPHNTPQSFQSFAQPQVPHSTPQSFQSFTQPPPPHTTPQSFHSVPSPSDRPHSKSNASVKSGGEEMGRSGSGGVKVGGKMIEFGDFPEKVDADAARQRVLKSWSEKEKKERERREASLRNERERREREKREASLKEERERRERSVGGSAEANNTTGGAVGLGIRRV